MKKSLWLVLICAGLFSCNNKESGEETVKEDSTDIPVKQDTAAVITDSHYFWTAELVPQQGLVMKKDSPVNEDSLNTGFMLKRLNDLYPEIKLQYIKSSNDSVFLKVEKSNYLTRQMGSTGAEAYLAEVTYNLTEVKGVNYVDIRFREGDHASPGTYSRTSFVHDK